MRYLDEQREAGVRQYHDYLLEAFGDNVGGLRWALTPCVVQHIGSESSKLGWGRVTWEVGSTADARTRLWSYGFEKEGERIMKSHGNFGAELFRGWSRR